MAWEVGDKAVCVDHSVIGCGGGLIHNAKICPQRGVVRTVGRVSICCCGCVSLMFDDEAGLASRFRKIVSDRHEPCEAEFVTLLNRIKRPVAA